MDIKDIIFDYIRKNGPITLDIFMEFALSRASNSYYKSKNPLDLDKGDFITSPEISQMFGEMIGIWIYNQWSISGKMQNISLVELGPGTGSLMRDILNLIKKTDMIDKITIYLLEINPLLISEQKEKLENYNFIRWIKSIGELPKNETIFIGNEFLDALPTKQFIKEQDNWKEVVIKLDNSGNNLMFSSVEIVDVFCKNHLKNYLSAQNGAIIEISKQTIEFIKSISNFIKNNGGAALFIDYGYDIPPRSRKKTQFSSTIQAMKEHKFCSILENISSSDITSHIDFNIIRQTAIDEGILGSESITQNTFLHKLGIFERLNILSSKNPELSEILHKQYYRLTSNDMMGELFKVIGLTNKEKTLFIFDFE